MRIVSPLPQRARHGACLKCGSSSSKRQYFDMEVFIEFEGGLFVCDVCVTEMAHELGFVAQTHHDNVKNNNQKLLTSNKDLRTRIEDQNKLIDTIYTERITREKEHVTAISNARTAAIQETEARYTK